MLSTLTLLFAALIVYPGVGLILFETGCAGDLKVVSARYTIDTHIGTLLNIRATEMGRPITAIFARTKYTENNKLPATIKATGNDIKDIKTVIIGHFHLDYAGGLENLVGTDVPIYVHEEELKHACWAVATGADLGVYLGHYMLLEKLNWSTFTESHLDLFQDIILHHLPGYTPGLCMMRINLEQDGVSIWTTDQFHVVENYELGHPQGGLARDHTQWCRSLNLTRRLQRLYNAKLVFGHDKDVAAKLMGKDFYT